MPFQPASDVLKDITVLEMTLARAGPTAGRQMADWGANVIKIEPPGLGGDRDFSARHSPDFQNLHRNKRSMTLNLKSEEGVGVFKRMAESADVIVENYRPDVKARLGVDYESIKAINPRIVYASISAFGQDGPYAERPGLDPVVQAMGGHMSVTGHPGQGPVRSGAAISDMMAGTLLANGIMLALFERERSGEGQWVQTTLMEACIFLLDFQAARYTMNGDVPGQAGNNHPTNVPTNAFRTSDGHVLLAPMAAMWEKFCKALGAEELIDDKRFASAKARFENRDELNPLIEARTETRTADEWVAAMNAVGVPSGPINTLDRTFADPCVEALGVRQTVKSPGLGEIGLVGQPVHLGRTGQRMVKSAPEYGADTDAVLAEFGYGGDEIGKLRADGIV